ncbi:MAG: methylisocitrate lyase [Thermoplasmata archaeon]|nr:methylisocitrate lyase [Candidatus Sysuiplasma acidicola]
MSDLLKKRFTVIPGVYSAFTALQAEKAGFDAVYLSGGALTSSMGIPDIGLITLSELSGMVAQIREVTDIPIVVDADTGFGGPVSVWRTVRTLEKAGADVVQLEDQKSPKRCGHLEGKELVTTEEMNEKIRAALAARKDALIIARTDARAVEGMDGAIDRAHSYVENGADIMFPEALLSTSEFSLFSKAVRSPLLANMTEFGKTPLIPASFFREAGYRYVIFPVTTFRAAAKATASTLIALKKDGTQKGIMDRMMTRDEQYAVLRYHDYEAMDTSFSSKKHANSGTKNHTGMKVKK